jgi:ribonuclease P protein component
MASVHGWPPQAAVECWPRGVRRAASAYLPKLFQLRPERYRAKLARPVRSMTAGLVKLKTRADFVRVAAGRRRAVRQSFILLAARRPSSDDNRGIVRVGFTASRKVGNAVVRNRTKRRLRAIAAAVLPGKGRPGMDYVLVARAWPRERPYAQLLADLEAALRQLDRQKTGERLRVNASAAEEA